LVGCSGAENALAAAHRSFNRVAYLSDCLGGHLLGVRIVHQRKDTSGRRRDLHRDFPYPLRHSSPVNNGAPALIKNEA
jgi:hypothetical protein